MNKLHVKYNPDRHIKHIHIENRDSPIADIYGEASLEFAERLVKCTNACNELNISNEELDKGILKDLIALLSAVWSLSEASEVIDDKHRTKPKYILAHLLPLSRDLVNRLNLLKESD